MVQYINIKLIYPILEFLKQGMSPGSLALAIVFGFAIGIFPMLGVTTIICAAVAFIFRLNMVVIQLVNYFVYPLQLILFIPFIKIGGIIFNTSPFPYTTNEILYMVQTDLWITIKELWLANMLGVLTWVVIILPVSLLLFFVLRKTFQKLKLNF